MAVVTVAVGRFGDVIGRGLLEILGEDRGLRVVGVGMDHAALQVAVAEGGVGVVVVAEDSAATPALARRLRGAPPGGSHLLHLSEGSDHLHRPGVGLVVLAYRPTRGQVTRMLAHGVNVCLSTDVSAGEIVRAVRLAAGGGHVFVSTSTHLSPGAPELGIRSLTRREREVLELLGAGRKTAEIARALNVSTETARTHTQHLYRKLGVSSRRELLRAE